MEAEHPFRLPLRFVAVADTDVTLANVGHQARFGVTPRLVSAASEGTVRIFAADHVYFEIYEKLAEVAADFGLPEDTLRTIFEEDHLPLMRFVRVAEAVPGITKSQKIVDLSDVPTGWLAELIAPCVLFSRDRHLREPGLAPENWLEVAKAAIHAGEGDRRERALGTLIYAPAAGSFLLTRWLGRRLGIPPLILWAGLALIFVNAIRNPERRKVVGKWVSSLAEAANLVLTQGRQLQETGLEELQIAAVTTSAPPSAESLVARVLAWAPEPMLAADIAQAIQSLPGGKAMTVGHVRSVLNSNDAFVRRQHARWELGRCAGPLRP